MSGTGNGGKRPMGERMDRIETRVDTVARDLKGLRGEVTDLRKEMLGGFATVASAIDTMNRNVMSALEKLNRDFNERLENFLVGPLGQTVRRHDADIRDLKGRVSRLEKKRRAG